jgi:hypothetical protein
MRGRFVSEDTVRRRGKMISLRERLREKRLREVLDEIARSGYDVYEDDDGIHYVSRDEADSADLDLRLAQPLRPEMTVYRATAASSAPCR